MNRLLKRWRKRVKVEIVCPCDEFIPAAYTPGVSGGRYGCSGCGLKVRLSTFRGDVDW